MAAARLHARLHTDLSRPVDVFRIVQELGIWLNSRPLGNLFGFYLRQGDALGICLNASHPETLQRYTCAHELGHHLLGHTSNLDDASDIDALDGGTPEQERAAQAFAGNFLMPLGLVNRVLRRLDLYDKSLTASDVYLVSRELDVSYTAATWRLRALDRITGPAATAYVKAGAAAAKESLRGGPPHGSARADLWVIENDDDVVGKCRVGDELLLRLVENRSTGYIWQIEEPAAEDSPEHTAQLAWNGSDLLTGRVDTSSRQSALPVTMDVLRVAEDRHREAEAAHMSGQTTSMPPLPGLGVDTDNAEHAWLRQALGVGGLREIAVVAESQGDGLLQVSLKPPWDMEADPMATIRLVIRVVPQHELDGFASLQPRAHVARLAA
jgi:Zn-dependent peptidase ImmA (M78 family)